MAHVRKVASRAACTYVHREHAQPALGADGTGASKGASTTPAPAIAVAPPVSEAPATVVAVLDGRSHGRPSPSSATTPTAPATALVTEPVASSPTASALREAQPRSATPLLPPARVCASGRLAWRSRSADGGGADGGGADGGGAARLTTGDATGTSGGGGGIGCAHGSASVHEDAAWSCALGCAAAPRHDKAAATSEAVGAAVCAAAPSPLASCTCRSSERLRRVTTALRASACASARSASAAGASAASSAPRRSSACVERSGVGNVSTSRARRARSARIASSSAGGGTTAGTAASPPARPPSPRCRSTVRLRMLTRDALQPTSRARVQSPPSVEMTSRARRVASISSIGRLRAAPGQLDGAKKRWPRQ